MKYLNFKSSLLFFLLTIVLTLLLLIVDGYFVKLFLPMWTSDLSDQEWIFWEKIVQDYWFFGIGVIYLPQIDKVKTKLSFIQILLVNLSAFWLCGNFMNFPISWISITVFLIKENDFLRRCSLIQKLIVSAILIIITLPNQVDLWDLISPSWFFELEREYLLWFFFATWILLCLFPFIINKSKRKA